MARICPNCSNPMHVEDVHGIQLDVCPQCAGIWFDAEELRNLMDRDPLALLELEDLTPMKITQESAGPSIRHCPADSFPLQNYHYLYDSPVVLEVCTDCGGCFIEEKELSKMQEWLNMSQRPISKTEEDRLFLAQVQIEHDNAMERQGKFLHFFNVLRQFRPGWIGLL